MERSTLPFFENRKNVPRFKKNALIVYKYGLNFSFKMQFRVTGKKLQNVSLRDLSLHVLDKMFFKVPLCRETPAALQNSWLRA